jgi:hypothetical protein
MLANEVNLRLHDSLLSGGETILTFIEDGARAVISFCIRSAVIEVSSITRTQTSSTHQYRCTWWYHQT